MFAAYEDGKTWSLYVVGRNGEQVVAYIFSETDRYFSVAVFVQ